jgi:hypothetical protein
MTAAAVEFEIDAVGFDAGRKDRIVLSGGDQEIVLVLDDDEAGLDDAEILFDGRPLVLDEPFLRIVGTLAGERYRVSAEPDPKLAGGASRARFTRIE